MNALKKTIPFIILSVCIAFTGCDRSASESSEQSGIAVLGLVFGVVFLLVAVASTVSKVTLWLLRPGLGREIRYSENPRMFIAVVFIYWLVGIAVVVGAIVSLLSGK
jgi:hypothetical protein